MPETLLEKINAALRNLNSQTQWKRLPDDDPAYAPLRDKVVLMVDDGKAILENFIPPLMVATNGHAACIHYRQGQDRGTLLQDIFASCADIVLMDYNLSGNLKGAEVVRLLKKQGFKGNIVGFSSVSERAVIEDFQRAGVIGCVKKNTYSAEEGVKELARFMAAQPQ